MVLPRFAARWRQCADTVAGHLARICLLSLLLAWSASGTARAAESAVPLPDRNPNRAAPAPPPKPEPLTHPGAVVTEDWTAEDIAAAKAKCAELLAGTVADYEMLEPLREGICGTPAPILLGSLGDSPKVEIRPPATLTCAMAASLDRWIRESLQPAAAAHLEDQVVSLRNVASYSCRNRYNAPGKRISEHANANALDIAAFETSGGKLVTVLESWNKTKDDGAPLVIAGDPDALDRGHESSPVLLHTPQPDLAPVPVVTTAHLKMLSETGKPPSIADNPEPLGQPLPGAEPAVTPAPQSLFVRTVHEGACKLFGTVLGPDSNEAHRDHFHLDMKERRYSNFCE